MSDFRNVAVQMVDGLGNELAYAVYLALYMESDRLAKLPSLTELGKRHADGLAAVAKAMEKVLEQRGVVAG